MKKEQLKKNELNDFYIYINSLENVLNEIYVLLTRFNNNYFKKTESSNIELVFHGTAKSFEKLQEFIEIMNKKKIEWKNQATIDLINKCITLNTMVLQTLKKSKLITQKSFNSIIEEKTTIIDKLTKEMNK